MSFMQFFLFEIVEKATIKKKIMSGRMFKPVSVKMFGPYDDRVIVIIVIL